MKKFARIFLKTDGQVFDIPIAQGNTFVNLILQIRSQGFIVHEQPGIYITHDAISHAFSIEQGDTVEGMTKQ